VSTPGLEAYLDRPLTPAAPEVTAAVSGPAIAVADALPLRELDRLLDPAPLAVENGWCALPDGVGYVAVRTPMPLVTGAMADWWFDWHPREALRYRVWHPAAHRDNRLEPPAVPGAKAHWNAVHHPVEDLGTGVVHARIVFRPPSAMGFTTDALDDARVATLVCGMAGDDDRRAQHTPMVHAFLREGDGVVLRSRFWLGAALRPSPPGVLGAAAGAVLNRPAIRRRMLPPEVPRALAMHCAEEFSNLAALLPELHARYA